MMIESFETKEEAIRAAVDSMETGDKLVVHEEHCKIAKRTRWLGLHKCTCKPQEWVCP